MLLFLTVFTLTHPVNLPVGGNWSIWQRYAALISSIQDVESLCACILGGERGVVCQLYLVQFELC